MSKISRLSVVWLGLLLIGAGYFHVQAARPHEPATALRAQARSSPTTPQATPTAQPSTAAANRALLDQYCVTCHNERLKTAGLMLDTANVERVGDAAPVWEKVVHMLRTGAMPPTGRPRPEAAAAQGFASYLEQRLDQAAAASPNPGRVPPHRLNRTEYANAVRDLLGLDVPASLLPADGSLLGFDNIAGVLSVSPMLLERYMSVARQVSRLAVGDPTMNVAPVLYTIEGALKQEDRLNDDLPFGSRGVTLRHSFPLDGEYMIQVRLKRTGNEYIKGLGRKPQPLEFRLDGQRLKRFDQAGLTKGIPPAEGYTQDDLGSAEWEKTALEGDNELEYRFPAKAGTRIVGIALPARRWDSDEDVILPSGMGGREEERDGNLSVATVEISGPYEAKLPEDSASRRKIFTCRPSNSADETRCAKTILTTLARRAYRRPLVDADVQSLMKFCEAGLSRRGFDGCIQSGIQRILASPHFLFRVEGDATSSSQGAGPAPVVANVAQGASAAQGARAAQARVTRLSDVDLASRLSFFIWSSIPDDQLLDLAEKGKLREPAVLEQQVRRMLADPRSRSLVDNFAAQWLELRRLDNSTPVENLFPDFDGELRDAFKQETERLIDSMLRDDRPIGDLLTANYTFVNERLARHYGIPNILGSHFRRVPTPERRVGLLGQGSILTVTSQTDRTSPVLRGKWVLENVLGAPVPPPPLNVPPLKPSNAEGKAISIRAALEAHRANPVCANCHARMDPWGFALENFDAIGAWRDKEGGQTIDVTSVLLDGTKLAGPTGVRQVLQGRRDQFVHNVSEKLLVYALGRPLEYYDRPALRKIATEAAARENRWSAVILGIVNSLPFQFQNRGAE